MKLYQAFGVLRGDVVAFVGAGGKTAALVGLGYELMELGWRVLATTTTSLDEEHLGLMPYAMRYHNNPRVLSQALTDHRFVFLYEGIRSNRAFAPKLDWTPQLLDTVDSDVLLVEADTANGLGWKCPYPDEPSIPREASLVVTMLSMSVVDKPLNDKTVYNAQAMTAKYGFAPNTAIHAPWLGQVLRDEEMGLKNVPDKARVVAFVNQTPLKGYARQRAQMIARAALKSPRFEGVAIGAVRAEEPVYEVQRAVGAVVLAGGMSARMGYPKMLLPWLDGKTVLENIVEQLMRSKLDHIIVVAGHYYQPIKRLLARYDVQLVYNRAYRLGGMLSSVQAGLRAMPAGIKTALLTLGDQPQLEPRVLYRLLKAYAHNPHSIVVPSYQMRRGHPYLVHEKHWADILALPATKTMRDFLHEQQPNILHVDVGSASILQDMDTREAYEQARHAAGLPPLDWQTLVPYA